MYLIKSKKWKCYELQLLKMFDGFAVVCLDNGSIRLSRYFILRKDANKYFNSLKYSEHIEEN